MDRNKADFSAVHTFAVCAYKQSPYLRECLESLRNQTVRSRIVLATSTPSAFLQELADEYGAEYRVNPDAGKGIAADWNFALSAVKTPYATIAHQDDIYLPEYAERVVRKLQEHPDTLIAFTDYADRLMPENRVAANRLYLHVKRLLLLPFYLKNSWRCGFMRCWILRFGNAICCPAVSYNLQNLPDLRFDAEYSVNLDWAMWLSLAFKPGRFCYDPHRLMQHRISESMETSSAIADHRRFEEDRRIFYQLWPHKIADFLLHFYAKSYESNGHV